MLPLGRMLMLIGGGLFVVGVLLVVLGRIPGLGQLPGDLRFHRGNVTVYIPLAR